MKPEEAIKHLLAQRNLKSYYVSNFKGSESFKAIDMATKALEKQIPKKPIPNYIGIETDAKLLCCPACRYQDDCDFEDLYDRKYNYCPMCGQALDWENETNEQGE